MGPPLSRFLHHYPSSTVMGPGSSTIIPPLLSWLFYCHLCSCLHCDVKDVINVIILKVVTKQLMTVLPKVVVQLVTVVCCLSHPQLLAWSLHLKLDQDMGQLLFSENRLESRTAVSMKYCIMIVVSMYKHYGTCMVRDCWTDTLVHNITVSKASRVTSAIRYWIDT